MNAIKNRKAKVGDIVIFDGMGRARRKGKIVKLGTLKEFGKMVYTKKYCIPLCRIRRIL